MLLTYAHTHVTHALPFGRTPHFTPTCLHYLTFYALHTSRLHPQGADHLVVRIHQMKNNEELGVRNVGTY